MVENVEKVLERGEKFELLVDKTDRLARQAFRFESSSRELKSAMFWRKVKMYSIYFGVAAVLGLILVSWACGGVTARVAVETRRETAARVTNIVA